MKHHVTITLADLERLGACESGLDTFESLLCEWGIDCIDVPDWTALHTLAVRRAYPGAYYWLRRVGLVPDLIVPRGSFENVSLRDVDLGGLALRGEHITHSQLTRVSWSGGTIQASMIFHGNMSSSLLQYLTVQVVVVQHSNMDCVQFDRVCVEGSSVLLTSMQNAILRHTSFREVMFDRVDLTEARIMYTTFYDCEFMGVDFTLCEFYHCKFLQCKFVGCFGVEDVENMAHMTLCTLDSCTFTSTRHCRFRMTESVARATNLIKYRDYYGHEEKGSDHV